MGLSLQGIFAKNRAEELGNDVWEQFVVPPFFDKLDLTTARKPRLIIGGRGCGKTMLLRYLSHQTIFSRSRPSIPKEAIKHVGLYWKADTHFLNLMTGRGVDDAKWHSAFIHMAAITLALEVLASLKGMAESVFPLIDQEDLGRLNFGRINSFDGSLPTGFDALTDELESRVWQLQTWVNDIGKAAEPRFLAGEKFVGAIIKEIKRQIPKLDEANYFVYLDEYENLAPYQKRIVNTWLKHSEIPLIFNLAIKRNAFEIQQTTGTESLANIHDYRIHDLEIEIEPAFESFAAEILFLQLAIAGREVPVDPAVLRDPERLNERRKQSYLDAVITRVEALFPGLTHEEMAKGIFDSPVIAKLRERVKKALDQRKSNLPVDAFVRPALPQASVVTPALLYRRNLEPDQIFAEMNKLESGEKSDFLISKQWVHNNFIGSYLQLFEPHSRPCPFYAGFAAFCQLSRLNLRHFLELCHQSISRVDSWDGESAVPIEVQADAARAASTAFLREVRSCGPYGEQLYTFVLRLGSLFAISHQRPTQSEPEQTHFSIGDNTIPMTEGDSAFLREAVKWSILYEEEETKQKDASEPEDVEYILDPIYAPYFHISYRKRRKIKLATDELITLIRGDYASVKDLLRRFSRVWDVDTGELTPTLFSHLGQD